MRAVFVVFLVILGLGACGRSQPAPPDAGAPAVGGPLVRVLLAEGRREVRVEATTAHRGYLDGDLAFRTPLPLDWPLVSRGGRLALADRPLGTSLLLVPEEPDGQLRLAGRAYRGSLRLIATPAGLRVVNLVPLEDYLRGVVPAEMQASWPHEALKAQAVAARTYILGALDPSADYDVCATVQCQVYRGVAAEHPRSDRAIADTAGVVLTYDGAFARTLYHADSGGMLASSAEVWGTALPYLVEKPDAAGSTPHRAWETRLDPQRVASSLTAAGWPVGRVEALRPLRYSDSGRVTQLDVVHAGGVLRLEGAPLREQLRAWGLKSTRFSMVGDLVVRGDGWGHGVGMSQYGARALAQAGYAYGQILAYYYPGTSLQRLAY